MSCKMLLRHMLPLRARTFITFEYMAEILPELERNILDLTFPDSVEDLFE